MHYGPLDGSWFFYESMFILNKNQILRKTLIPQVWVADILVVHHVSSKHLRRKRKTE